jgi:transcriptional regulator with XRE-family HTH domain
VTFGQAIAAARKRAGLSQKDLAARIKKDDGQPISAQYLHDLEHDRRNPPATLLLRQLAAELGLAEEYLDYLAGRLPEDLRDGSSSPETVREAFQVFRRALKDGSS